MPITPTYPGVYVQEIPSGVRTITGVATSITAFVGRALRGPTDEPIAINSYGDFERIFGGLWLGSKMGYAVRDFYLNGGGQAIVVRLYHEETPTTSRPLARTPIKVDALTLEARYPGSWGENLRVSIDSDVSESVAASMGLTKDALFNLTVRDTSPGGRTEQFRNLTVEDNVRRVDKVLAAESRLVVWCGNWPTIKPDMVKLKAVRTAEGALRTAEKVLATAPGDATKKQAVPDARTTLESAAGDLDDAVGKAEKALAAKKKATPQADVSTEETALTTARVAVKTSDGGALTEDDFIGASKEGAKQGLYALEKADLFNILCLPPYLATDDVDADLVAAAAAYVESRRAMLLVDPPSTWKDKDSAKTQVANIGTVSKNAALFFPRLRQSDSLRDNQPGNFVPCGAVAGIFSRTDMQRGVWKAPAGFDATLVGVPELSVALTDAENGELNPLGINCLRSLPVAGRVIWGTRTLQGDDRLASEWKYIPVRRLALFIEESLYRGTQWVVFEPNDEPLWAQIRLNLGTFMHDLFRKRAFQGQTPTDAYFVKCDHETTTQSDIDLGIVNIVVGFAPLKPAEFVIISLQQMAGQLQA